MTGSRDLAPGRHGEPIPRSRIPIGLDSALRGRLAALSRGRTIVIDFFSSRCCTAVRVGDLTVRWLDGPPDPTMVPLAPIEGVPVVAEPRLLDVLADAGPTLRRAGSIFARGLGLDLERPERWLEFLDTPAAARRRAPRRTP